MLTIQTQSTQLQVRCRSVAFAGSRHGSVDPKVAGPLVGSLSSLGFSFFVGCAPGVDAAFRKALSDNPSAKTIVACAFETRERKLSSKQLCALTVVPDGLRPAAALHRFALMIENQYGRQAKIQIADELLPFHSEAVTDILVGLGITEARKAPVIR